MEQELSDSEKLLKSLVDNAGSPKKVETDDMTVEQHSISDLIKLQKFIEEKEAKKKRKLPFKILRIKPGGMI